MNPHCETGLRWNSGVSSRYFWVEIEDLKFHFMDRSPRDPMGLYFMYVDIEFPDASPLSTFRKSIQAAWMGLVGALP
jgi:hypothetical protein